MGAQLPTLSPQAQPAAGDLVLEVVKEARRREESADFAAQVQFEAAKFWGWSSTSLSLVAAAAAFGSGASILQSPPGSGVAGLLAFIAGTASVADLVLHGSDRRDACTRAGQAWRCVRDQARVLANIGPLEDGFADAWPGRLANLTAAYNAAEDRAPLVGWAGWAVRRARRNLEKGLTQHAVDRK